VFVYVQLTFHSIGYYIANICNDYKMYTSDRKKGSVLEYKHNTT